MRAQSPFAGHREHPRTQCGDYPAAVIERRRGGVERVEVTAHRLHGFLEAPGLSAIDERAVADPDPDEDAARIAARELGGGRGDIGCRLLPDAYHAAGHDELLGRLEKASGALEKATRADPHRPEAELLQLARGVGRVGDVGVAQLPGADAEPAEVNSVCAQYPASRSICDNNASPAMNRVRFSRTRAAKCSD